MRWRWLRLRKPRSSDADQALEVSQQRYEEARSRRGEVEQVGRGHRQLRQHNHFADAIRKALEGRS